MNTKFSCQCSNLTFGSPTTIEVGLVDRTVYFGDVLAISVHGDNDEDSGVWLSLEDSEKFAAELADAIKQMKDKANEKR